MTEDFPAQHGWSVWSKEFLRNGKNWLWGVVCVTVKAIRHKKGEWDG